MKNNALVILVIILLSACGPTGKLRRAEKLIKKAELLGATWTADTVWVQRVVFRPETRVDSIIVIKPGDSVIVFKDRLSVKITRLPGDTVYVDAKCAADTVKIEVPVTVTKMIEAKCNPWWWYLIAGLIGAAILMFVIFLAKVL